MPNTVIIIPARMGSTRFPAKPLALIYGKTMIERVWRIAKACQLADDVIIATDSEVLLEHIQDFGATGHMTPSSCQSGTDRVATCVNLLEKNYDIIFNLQGDAVLTPPWIIDELIQALKDNPSYQIVTPAVALQGTTLQNFLMTKKQGSSTGTTVVFNQKYEAMYFSKQAIPFHRQINNNSIVYRHIGLYGYRRDALLQLNALPPSYLETIEGLEQLRALEHGIPIQVIEVDYQNRTHGSVDQPQDISFVENIINQEGELIPYISICD